VHLTQVETRNGMVPVSSKETTLLDLANDLNIVGGIDNAANLVIELCETSDICVEALVELSANYPVTAVRRLGFLMESYTDVTGLEYLKAACIRRNNSLSLLDPQGGHGGKVNTEWRIRINREVFPDV
jgi:predicted transcriptional regulator of viral defense system